MPTVVQINLKRSRVALDNLVVLLREEDIDIGIIQEPWTRDMTVLNLSAHGYDIIYKSSKGRPRTCIIIIKKTL